MSKHKIIKSDCPGKLAVRVFRTRKGRVLEFRAMIAYSYIAQRTKQGNGTTLNELSRSTGLNRQSSCIAIHKTLKSHGMVTSDGGYELTALPPSANVGSSMQLSFDAPIWQDTYAYRWFVPFHANSPVNLADAWVYWTLFDLAKARITHGTYAGLGTLTGMHRITVAKCVARLNNRRLIRLEVAKVSREKYKVTVLKPTEIQLSWMVDFQSKKEIVYEEVAPDDEVYEEDAPDSALVPVSKPVTMHRQSESTPEDVKVIATTDAEKIDDRTFAFQQMQILGMSEREQRTCIYYLPLLPHRGYQFVTILHNANEQWRKEREDDPDKRKLSKTCGKLFLSWLRDYVNPPVRETRPQRLSPEDEARETVNQLLALSCDDYGDTPCDMRDEVDTLLRSIDRKPSRKQIAEVDEILASMDAQNNFTKFTVGSL